MDDFYDGKGGAVGDAMWTIDWSIDSSIDSRGGLDQDLRIIPIPVYCIKPRPRQPNFLSELLQRKKSQHFPSQCNQRSTIPAI